MRRTGFTLIEILVVISTIALLMAILVPALQNSRRQAKVILCGSNIKNLALGLTMYENDNETFPHALDETPLGPPPGGYPGNPMYDRMGWWWFNYTTDYSRKNRDKPSVILCPSRKIENVELKNDVLCGNYGVNRSVCKTSHGLAGPDEFTGRPLRISDISRASETLLVLDSGYSMIAWQHATNAPDISLRSTPIENTAYVPGLRINEERDFLPGQEQDAVDGRHPNRSVNVGFVDGHVSRTKADDLFVEKSGDSYRNRYPLWLPK